MRLACRQGKLDCALLPADLDLEWHQQGGIGAERVNSRGCDQMVRFLALLTVVVIAVLAEAGPAAYADALWPVAAQQTVPSSSTLSQPSDSEDCGSQFGCCTANCAACYSSMSSQRTAYVAFSSQSARSLIARQDCQRSIILGRDPPIPRTHLM